MRLRAGAFRAFRYSVKVGSSWPSSRPPVSSSVAGDTMACWVTVWTSRKQRCSALERHLDTMTDDAPAPTPSRRKKR